MRRTCCTSPRRGWLLPLLVTSLVFGGAAGRPSGEPAVCSWSCCSVLPSCRTARTVDCNCPGHDTMVFRSGDLPATARNVIIQNTNHVIVEENAFETLHALIRLSISDIKQLELKPGGMTLHDQNSLGSASFEKIGSFHVAPKAFSGFWLPQTTIRMGRVVDLHIETGAFDIEVEDTGPSITLDHVQDLNLASRGFSAQFSSVDMLHVHMDTCQEGNFGQRATYTRWKNVNIQEAKTGCYEGLGDSATFVVRESEIRHASHKAIAGSVHSISFTDSQIGNLQEKALHIRADRFALRNSFFHTLHPFSLSANVTGHALLEYLRINELQKNALTGLRLIRTNRWAPPRLHLYQLEIITAQNGSLKLSSTADQNNFTASYISVKSRRAPVCPTVRYGHVLITGSSTGRLSRSEDALVSALIGNTLCDDLETAVGEPGSKASGGEGYGTKGMTDGIGEFAVASEAEDVDGLLDEPEAIHGSPTDIKGADVSEDGSGTDGHAFPSDTGHDRGSEDFNEDAYGSEGGTEDTHGSEARTEGNHGSPVERNGSHGSGGDVENDHGSPANNEDDYGSPNETSAYRGATEDLANSYGYQDDTGNGKDSIDGIEDDHGSTDYTEDDHGCAHDTEDSRGSAGDTKMSTLFLAEHRSSVDVVSVEPSPSWTGRLFVGQHRLLSVVCLVVLIVVFCISVAFAYIMLRYADKAKKDRDDGMLRGGLPTASFSGLVEKLLASE